MFRIIQLFIALILLVTVNAKAEDNRLIILHTNDTHSQIDPADNGLGGVLRRKAAIDSLRNIFENVMLVDAGDAVQGTMYFTIYKGEVEYRLLDELGYDIAILGNHDFDNGTDALGQNLRNSSTRWISTNYDFSDAPTLDSIFSPWIIKEYSGKKVGIMGINLIPKGMIAEGNYTGVEYIDAITAANTVAAELREHGADYVIAVTHIGYDGNVEPNDCSLAAATQGIDIIIGAHSHSLIEPSSPSSERFHWRHTNAVGGTIAVVQTGSRGANLGQLILNLENGDLSYNLLPMDSTLDNRIDPHLKNIISNYSRAVDSIMQVPVGYSERRLGKEDAGLMNFLGDFVLSRGEELSGTPVDIAIINAGGVRRELPQGIISKGMLIDMLPFNNKIVVLEIKGSDLQEAIDGIIRRGALDGVNSGVSIVFDPDILRYVSATIAGNEIMPGKTYRLATIDYLANGGDYMYSLPRATVKTRSDNVLYDDLIEYVTTKWTDIPINAEPQRRIIPIRQ